MAENTQQAEIDQLKESLAKSNKDRDEAIETVAELSAQLDVQEKNTDGSRITKIGKKQYKVLGKKFNIPKLGKELTLDELLKDKEALEHLVKINSGVLVEVK